MNLHGSLLLLQFLMCLMCFRFHSDHWFDGIFLMKLFAFFFFISRVMNSIQFFKCVWGSSYFIWTTHYTHQHSMNLVVVESLLLFTVSSRVILYKCPVTQSLSPFFGSSTFVHEILSFKHMRKYSCHCRSNFRFENVQCTM